MRVIIVNDFGSVTGGASHVAITEALGLADRGHDVTYFYSIGPLDPRLEQHDRIQAISSDEFDLLTEPNRVKAAIKGIWNKEARDKIDDVLDHIDKRETIVHLHGWSRSLGPLIGKTIQQHGLPLVYTLHDYFIACPNGGFFNYQKDKICPLKPLSVSCLIEHCDSRVYIHKLWRYLRTFVEKYGAKLPNPAMDFIAVSDLSLRVLQPYLPKESSVHKLSNPIHVPHDLPARITQNDHYVFIGRLSAYKGPRTLAQANKNSEFSLTYVGDGELRDAIHSLDEKATITGWLKRVDVFKQLDQARALIFPSRGYETQGMVVLEAASRGVPAIISDSCAATEFVEDGVTGLWFQHGDPEDLREKMLMLQDNDFLSQLGAKAYQRYWEKPFLTERHNDDLVSIYEEILTRSRTN